MTAWLDALVDALGAGFTPDVAPPWDLRALCRAAGRLPTALPELPPRRQLRRTGGGRTRVTCLPLAVTGVIDGIQPPAKAVTWWDGRPVALLFVSAGHLRLVPRGLSALEERLLIVCSHLDEERARSISPGIPVVPLAERFPDDLVAGVGELHRGLRHRLERDVLDAARGEDAGVIVVDGSIADVPGG